MAKGVNLPFIIPKKKGSSMNILRRVKSSLSLVKVALCALIVSLVASAANADAGYDSLTTNTVAGVTAMKAGISPVLGAIIGLALFISAVALVIRMVKSRTPKVV